jgi:hypothetical protein
MDEPSNGQPRGAFLTRLHVRYDAAHFPEDLVFQETADRANFQGRYVLRHAFAGELTCAAPQYRESVHQRHEREAKTLAELTGWDMNEIRRKMNLDAEGPDPRKWWEKIWTALIAHGASPCEPCSRAEPETRTAAGPPDVRRHEIGGSCRLTGLRLAVAEEDNSLVDKRMRRRKADREPQIRRHSPVAFAPRIGTPNTC